MAKDTKYILSSILTLVTLIFFVCLVPGIGYAQTTYGEKIEFVSQLGGRQETVFGYLSLPKAMNKPVPAMVLVHGSSGLGEREERYLVQFKKMGIATFALDSFTPRRVYSTAEDQARVRNAPMVSDAFGALKLLRDHPRIEKDRIGIIGWGKGGAVALDTAIKQPARARKLPDDLRFAAHVSLYPGCDLQFRTPVTTGAPILMLLAGRDDYTGVENCQLYANSMKRTGADITVIVYPDAEHYFDGKDGRRHYRAANIQNFLKCLTYIDEEGKLVDAKTGEVIDRGKYFELVKNCMTWGASFGTDPVAKKKSLEDIQDFLKQSLLKE